MKRELINDKIKNIRARINLNKGGEDINEEKGEMVGEEEKDENDMTRTFAMDVNESFGGHHHLKRNYKDFY